MEECRMVNAVDLRTVKVGDRVWSLGFGWGMVSSVEVDVKWSKVERAWVTFTLLDTDLAYTEKCNRLFYGPPEIIGPEKPRVKVKKQLWIVYAQEKGINGCFGIKKAAEGYIKSSGLIGVASIHPVEIEVEE